QSRQAISGDRSGEWFGQAVTRWLYPMGSATSPGNRHMSPSATSRVSREKRGHILLLGLDRVAKRNAFDLELLNQLCLAYGEFERDQEARVALVFAHGEHFTAGLDLANIAPVFAAGWQVPEGGCDPWGVFGGQRV